jgi:hypothetical protein
MTIKSNGPGKYDDACTAARIATQARAAVLIVTDGNRGSGFSVQAHDPAFVLALPMLLRRVADDIEAQTHPEAAP